MTPTLKRRNFLAGGAALCCSPLPALAQADEYPKQPITIYLPVAAGGSLDSTMRAAVPIVSQILKQPVILEAKPGGNTALQAQLLARARPDGYTLGTISSVQLLLPYAQKVDFDPVRDFTYVIGMFGFPSGAVVRADSRYRTFDDLVQAARAEPGKISIGTSGITTSGGLATVYFEKERNTRFLHTPFRGAEANTALLGGHIDSVWGGPSWTSLVDGGRLRLLALFSERRAARYPNVPTAKELGYPLANLSTQGIAGPAGLDPRIVRTLHDAFKQAIDTPQFKKVSNDLVNEEWYRSSAEYTAWAAKEFADNKVLAQQLGLKPE